MSVPSTFAGQPPQRGCLNMLVTCAWCPDHPPYFKMPSSVNGVSLIAYRVNTYAQKPVRKTTYHAPADTTLHLFRSEYRDDLYFVVEPVPYRQKFKCSCELPLCEHIKAMRGISS